MLFIKKYNFKETKQALKWCYKAVVTVVLCVVVIAGGNLLKTGLGYIPVAIEEVMPDVESHLSEKDKFLHGKERNRAQVWKDWIKRKIIWKVSVQEEAICGKWV